MLTDINETKSHQQMKEEAQNRVKWMEELIIVTKEERFPLFIVTNTVKFEVTFF